MTAAIAEAPAIHRGYRFDIEPVSERIRVEVGGVTVADSDRAVVMRETRLAPVYYFPQDDVRMDLLRRTDLRTYCPFKGNASYWSLEAGERVIENAVWGYEEPFEEAASVKGYVALYWEKMDAWYVDDVRMLRPAAPTGADANPFVDWLVRKAPHAKTPDELVLGFAHMLVATGMPLWRLRVLIRTLHPQVLGSVYAWQSDTDELKVHHPSYEVLERREFRDSPYASVLRGEGGIRRRLDGPEPELDFPILEDLREQGATDYVAMPLKFSNGQLNIITLVSQAPGGFTTEDLGQLYEVLAMLARLLEVHAMHRIAGSLLDTYLGRNAGRRVLDGLIKRGDGEDKHAVIWFSDLRNSTMLSETLPRETYLALLNGFFDAVAGAIMDHGGEVLKFIGDAVLAIFPIDDPANPEPASANAIAAVREAERRLAVLDQERRAAGEIGLGHGIALHRGDLTYGNIGAAERLDFTVIGPAVNEASRIEGMCKELDRSVLLSARFAESFAGELHALGRHRLRGVEAEQELFTLPADETLESAAE